MPLSPSTDTTRYRKYQAPLQPIPLTAASTRLPCNRYHSLLQVQGSPYNRYLSLLQVPGSPCNRYHSLLQVPGSPTTDTTHYCKYQATLQPIPLTTASTRRFYNQNHSTTNLATNITLSQYLCNNVVVPRHKPCQVSLMRTAELWQRRGWWPQPHLLWLLQTSRSHRHTCCGSCRPVVATAIRVVAPADKS